MKLASEYLPHYKEDMNKSRGSVDFQIHKSLEKITEVFKAVERVIYIKMPPKKTVK